MVNFYKWTRSLIISRWNRRIRLQAGCMKNTKKYVAEHDKTPDLLADEQIVEAVLDKINEAQIRIPDGEIYDYYRRKKPYLQKRLDNEKMIKFKSDVSFYKSIVD